jgi:AraC-like DNA-binding protein
MAPGQVHCLNLKASSTGYLVGFKPEFLLSYNKEFNQLLRRAASINLHHCDARTFKKLLPLLATMFQEYTLKHEQYEEVIKATMNVFFIELTRQNSLINSIGKNRYQQQTLERFLELVETHITTHKHMSQYAAILNLSSFQLNAITKALRGKTSSQIITEYIILESKRYLLASTSQVTQIAYQLGYEDASYFIRFFKKNTGYTPDVFRHNFR